MGSISATGSGATAPYLFSIDGVNFQASNFFGGLAAGNYTVTAKDVIGCTGQASISILNTNGPILNFTSSSTHALLTAVQLQLLLQGELVNTLIQLMEPFTSQLMYLII